jgi:hypothetical protein
MTACRIKTPRAQTGGFLIRKPKVQKLDFTGPHEPLTDLPRHLALTQGVCLRSRIFSNKANRKGPAGIQGYPLEAVNSLISTKAGILKLDLVPYIIYTSMEHI